MMEAHILAVRWQVSLVRVYRFMMSESQQPICWREHLNNIEKMRYQRNAPVDFMGCEQICDKSAAPQVSVKNSVLMTTVMIALMSVSLGVRGGSTIHALLKIMHDVFSAADCSENIIRILFVSFAKAFDLIDHNVYLPVVEQAC